MHVQSCMLYLDIEWRAKVIMYAITCCCGTGKALPIGPPQCRSSAFFLVASSGICCNVSPRCLRKTTPEDLNLRASCIRNLFLRVGARGRAINLSHRGPTELPKTFVNMGCSSSRRRHLCNVSVRFEQNSGMMNPNLEVRACASKQVRPLSVRPLLDIVHSHHRDIPSPIRLLNVRIERFS